ncbi:bestrophin family protein [Acinetobacter bereziniae]|uniref:bestrophin family protein n=1 Tax=Acinetobacter bereziniae TaxID=106648 RepID=UPI00124FB5CA|nr:bestrophin family protein [Acinetobacter bereziniae]MBI0393585.1 bestrophin family protein [Acinetobacter bereziniae]MCU4416632.1 bestrophin family protein [Acinetobacter bereziniae]
MIIRDKSNSFALLFAWHGTILPKVLPALAFVVLISTILVYLSSHHYFTFPAVPAIGFTVFGIILSIFLSFRNTACYDRWWEGRKLWGALIATSRHISRDSHVLPEQQRQVLMYRVMLFTCLLRNRLRNQNQAIEFYKNKVALNDSIFDQLPHHINASQYVLEQIQKSLVSSLHQGEISDIIYQGLNQHIVALGNIQAGCDRILSTPLPYSYSVLLHRTVYCFCLILPFSLEASLGIWTPVIVSLIAYLFLGLDALSAQLEEPFGLQENDLPLDAITRLIEREMLSSLGEELLEPIQLVKSNLT